MEKYEGLLIIVKRGIVAEAMRRKGNGSAPSGGSCPPICTALPATASSKSASLRNSFFHAFIVK